MRFLIVETSTRVAKVGLAEGEEVRVERRLDEARRHARDLAPTVGELLVSVDWRPQDVDAVAVSVGPGSYTGLRVGIMSAKAFAYAVKRPLVGVPTFDAIARQVPADVEEAAVLADAQQGRVYVQWFGRESGVLRPRSQLAIVPFADFRATLSNRCVVTGPGASAFEADLAGCQVVEASTRSPSCRGLLQVALASPLSDDAVWAVEPLYLRPSAAEEQWDRRSG